MRNGVYLVSNHILATFRFSIIQSSTRPRKTSHGTSGRFCKTFAKKMADDVQVLWETDNGSAQSEKLQKHYHKTEYGREGNHCIHHAFLTKLFCSPLASEWLETKAWEVVEGGKHGGEDEKPRSIWCLLSWLIFCHLRVYFIFVLIFGLSFLLLTN